METLEQELTKLFKRELRDGSAELDTLPNDHVYGHVVSSEFDAMNYEQRRARLKEILDASELEAEQLLKVSTLLTYTPEEWSVKIPDA